MGTDVKLKRKLRLSGSAQILRDVVSWSCFMWRNFRGSTNAESSKSPILNRAVRLKDRFTAYGVSVQSAREILWNVSEVALASA